MDEPVALFITWTTFGTWLPGDKRGHVSNTLLTQGEYQPRENQFGTPYAVGDAQLRERARDLQKSPTVWLTAAQALVVAHTLVRVATEHGWTILRAAIMANHTHVVVINCRLDGPAVRRILKGNSQADLSDSVGTNRRWWTRGGSDRLRRGDRSIEATVHYVANQRGKLAEVIDNVAVIPEKKQE